MRAMVLESVGGPLRGRDRASPQPASGQVRLAVLACGVCRTDLHVVDGELPGAKLPLIPGHQIVGVVQEIDRRRPRPRRPGTRVGVPWLGFTCGSCPFCTGGPREPLRTAPASPATRSDGGYAEAGRGRRALLLPPARRATPTSRPPPSSAPGLIGYRAFRMIGRRAGASASSASARPRTSSPSWPARPAATVFAFTRRGDAPAPGLRAGAGRLLGGSGGGSAPGAARRRHPLRPRGRARAPGPRPRPPRRNRGLRRHPHERRSRPSPTSSSGTSGCCAPWPTSPAGDGQEFLRLAPAFPLHTEVQVFPLAAANEALLRPARGADPRQRGPGHWLELETFRRRVPSGRPSSPGARPETAPRASSGPPAFPGWRERGCARWRG